MEQEEGLVEKKACRKEMKKRTMAVFGKGGNERRQAVEAKK
jgi:hypothetical protein